MAIDGTAGMVAAVNVGEVILPSVNTSGSGEGERKHYL